jgi:hypothetical protein
VSFTLSTIPLGVLALLLCCWAKWRLLPVAMFMSVFQAASVMNVANSIGLGISYVLLLMALGQAYLLTPPRPKDGRRGRASGSTLVILFGLYATLSAIVFPLCFEGTLYTNPKMGFNVPLRWEPSHLNQLAYLFLCIVLFLTVSYRTSMSELKRAVDWYVAGNGLASVIAIYQFVCLRTGLPFPSEFLYTNPVYGIFHAYEISGFARVNSTFVEASAAAGFLSPALAILCWRLLDKPTWKDGVYAALIGVGLFLTISTTGYLCFGFLMCLASAVYFFKWNGPVRPRIAKLLFGASLGFAVIALLGASVTRQAISELLDVVVLSKSSTYSYKQRGEMNADAWQTASDTAWLGAGFGVCRGSSLLPTLTGNVGVPGVLLFSCFLLRVFRPAWRTTRRALTFQGELLFACAVVLFGLLVAGPEITGPPMWLFLAGATVVRPVVGTSRSCRGTMMRISETAAAPA